MHFWQGKSITVNILFSRAGVAQHIWVCNEHGALLFDAGDGVLRDILSNNLDFDKLTGIVFTHGHFDHVGGLHSLLGYLRMIGRKQTLPIYAPQGCTELFALVDTFTKCYADTMPFNIDRKKLQPHEIFEHAGMIVEPYPVVHCGGIKDATVLDKIPAFGYRITYKHNSIAISGDTAMCPSLRELVKDADLAIIEATLEKSEGSNREVLEKVHLSEDLAKEIGKLAKEYILIHKGKRKREVPIHAKN